MSKFRSWLLLLLVIFLIFGKGCSSKNETSDNPISPDLSVVESGTASWYGEAFQGKRTAGGEYFDMNKLTAAHKTFPFGTVVEVTNLGNGRTVQIRINDRGPYVNERIIDVSKRAAIELGMLETGLAQVSLRIVKPA